MWSGFHRWRNERHLDNYWGNDDSELAYISSIESRCSCTWKAQGRSMENSWYNASPSCIDKTLGHYEERWTALRAMLRNLERHDVAHISCYHCRLSHHFHHTSGCVSPTYDSLSNRCEEICCKPSYGDAFTRIPPMFWPSSCPVDLSFWEDYWNSPTDSN